MSVEIKWIGHASFRIAGSGGVVYIDPWKLLDEPHDADVVIVSHGHSDHCSPQDVEKVSNSDTTVLAPADTACKLRNAGTIAPGQTITVGDVIIEAVAAYNADKKFHPKNNNWIGAVITLDDKRIYYAGDTDLIDEMESLDNIDVALLPIGGTYTMDSSEAAQACERIGCKIAVGYHWGDIVGSQSDAEAFIKAVTRCKIELLQNGQAITI